MPTQGIYKITNTSSGRVYIGQSCCIENRLAAHRRYLVRGVHDNQRLQRAWNKHGGDSFSFEVLEVVNDSNHLTSREQFWIDALDAAGSGGYNMCPAAGSCKGYKHTQESIARRKGKVPWNKGMRKQYKLRPATQDRKSKIGNAQKAKKTTILGSRHHRKSRIRLDLLLLVKSVTWLSWMTKRYEKSRLHCFMAQ